MRPGVAQGGWQVEQALQRVSGAGGSEVVEVTVQADLHQRVAAQPSSHGGGGDAGAGGGEQHQQARRTARHGAQRGAQDAPLMGEAAGRDDAGAALEGRVHTDRHAGDGGGDVAGEFGEMAGLGEDHHLAGRQGGGDGADGGGVARGVDGALPVHLEDQDDWLQGTLRTR
jgi:hypothetical protein